jgi:glutamate decarboxylase
VRTRSINIRQKTKKALANLDTMRKVFTLPESESSTLAQIDREISENLRGFLQERIVAGDIAPANLEQDFMETKIPEDPIWVSEQTEFLLSKVVAQSVHTSSPRFIGHMTSALPYFMMPLAKIMIALNQNVVKIETSKVFTPLERQVIGMLHRLIYDFSDTFYQKWTQNFSHSLGVMTSGGTIANITGLWVARNKALAPKDDFRGVAEEGFFRALKAYGYEDTCVVVSERGHYSISKAADLIGLGRNQVIRIPVNHSHKIDLKVLEKRLLELREKKTLILALIGIAGTTETGSVDPLDALADLAQEFGTRFHVDAAWGGPTLFSQKHKNLLKGIERADSVAFDAHKQLYVPMGAGMILFKDPKSLDSIEHHAQYIIRQGSRDIGKHTLEGSRGGMAMLVHSALRIIGKRGYEILIDEGIAKAALFAKMIRVDPDFELITDPELNLLTYRYVPPLARELLKSKSPEVVSACNEILSNLTESIQKRQRQQGKTFVSRTRLQAHAHQFQNVSVFRVVLANPLTTRAILAEILEEQRSYGQELVVSEGFDNQLLTLSHQHIP